ncbi:MAG: response regulator transcription factor [Chloroflexi bacterium]|nr:response regulator transcription factor [Chloroflexota bacterium]
MANDPELRCSIVNGLACENFDVIYEANGGQGVARILDMNPEVIVLSEDTPVVGGVEYLPLIRRVTSAPIVIVGDGDEMRVVSALVNGADMYVRKPVNSQELVSRVRALCRRIGTETEFAKAGTAGTLSLDDLPEDVRLSLTDTETRLLVCLMERCGDVIGHEELMMNVWGMTVKRERLRFYVHRLRRKLKSAVIFDLHTRIGVGYRLIRIDIPQTNSALP